MLARIPGLRLARRCGACVRRTRLYSTEPKNVLDELEKRGMVAALTSPDIHTHLGSPATVYVGVDPSASSLHVGNLLPLMGLLHFRRWGHTGLALIGGATGSIGDPSGRSTERQALDPAALQHNVDGITAQIHRFFRRAGEYAERRRGGLVEPGARSAPRAADRIPAAGGGRADRAMEIKEGEVHVVNNLEWTRDVTLLDFLRDVGKLARVGVMLQRDAVRSRLETTGISFTEFTYQLLQANDFAHLFRHRNCTVQLGGSDQWGNIIAGIDLIRRLPGARSAAPSASSPSSPERIGSAVLAPTYPDSDEPTPRADEGDRAFGVTMPLLTTASGEKFGKSAGNAVWLDEARTSVSDFYQFFVRSTDDDVEKYLKVLTCLPFGTIADVMAGHRREPKARVAQRILAEEVTELVHGRTAVRKAQTIATALFSTSIRSLRASDVLEAFAGDPRLVRRPRAEVLGGPPASKLAVEHGLCRSRGEANRLISSGGLYLNDAPVADPRRGVSRSDLIDGRLVILRRGALDTQHAPRSNHIIATVAVARAAMSEPFDPPVPARQGPWTAPPERAPYAQGVPHGLSAAQGGPESAAKDQKAKIAETQREIELVKDQLGRNIVAIQERGERLDHLTERTDHLRDQSKLFNSTSGSVRRKMWWKNMKWTILIALLVICVLGSIIGGVVRARDQ
ncbi:tyrosyl-tRNA synthetase [Cryptotrichosporon argae]